MGVALVVALLTLLIIEGALSLGGAPSVRDRMVPPASAVRPVAPLLATESGPWRDHPDVRVGRTLRPGVDVEVFGVTVASDELGLRRRGTLAEGTQRMVVLGGTDVFGVGLDAAETWAADVERAWREAPSATDAPALACLPVALPGWTLRNALAFLGDHLDELTPDLVIVRTTNEDLSDTLSAGRDGTPGIQRDALSSIPFAWARRDVLEANIAALATASGASATPGPWLLEGDATRLSIRRFDALTEQVARLVERTRNLRPDVRWVFVDDGRGVFERLQARLADDDVAVQLWTPPDAWTPTDFIGALANGEARAEPRPLAARSEVVATLFPSINIETLRGVRQIYGGLHGDGTIDAAFAVGLRRRPGGDALVVRAAAARDGPALVVLGVYVDDERVGELVVARGAGVVGRVWSCEPTSRGTSDVELRADQYRVHADGRSLVSVRLVSLGFP